MAHIRPTMAEFHTDSCSHKIIIRLLEYPSQQSVLITFV